MAKPNIITRATKGSALSWTEGDANLENLRDATIGISDGTTSGTLDLNDTLTFTAGTNVTVAYDINSKSLTINSTATGGLQSVSQDLAPVLGGTLNVNGNYITGNLDENVRILPSGVGRVNLSGLLYPSVDGTSGQVLSTDGAGNISWSNAGGLTSIIQDTAPVLGGNLNVNNYQITNNPYADLQITAGMGGLVSLSADGGVRIQSIYYPGPSGASQGQYLAFDGSNSLVWTSPSSGGGLTSISQDNAPALGGILDVGPYSITSTTGGISLNPAYGSPVTINGMQWPTVDGTSGQALTTNGYGNLSWTTIAGGSLNQDYNPQLVASLDVQSYSITTTATNGDILLAPNGTGKVVVGQYSSGSATITTQNNPYSPVSLFLTTSGVNGDDFLWNTSGYIKVGGGSDQNIIIMPHGNGKINLQNHYWPSTDGTADQVLKTDGAGNLSWTSAEDTANKGQPNGYAGLDASGLVPSTQLPSYVDDVLEYADLASFPTTGETGKIYVAADTSRSYRWTGSVYSEIIASPGTTDNVTEGSTNLYFTTQRARDSFTAGTGISIVSGAISSTVTPGIASVSADTAPSLGGNLNVNGKNIVSVSNGNITIAPNGTGKTKINNINYYETPYTLTYSATITPNVTNGNVQVVTLTGNVTFSAFTSPVAGQSLTLIVKQDATGSRTLTSTMKFSGGTKTLSTAANSVDIITVFYDGTNYWASLGKDFK